MKKLTKPRTLLAFLQNRYYPAYLWEQYLKQCDSIRQTSFLLSFDCDTELDIEVLPGVIAKLEKIGIRPVLAVPGELIEKGQAVYKKFSENGIEFINHGYVQHTHVELPQRKYTSSFFYSNLSKSEIKQDISKGHAAICEYLGVRPKGFRTPHFGSYQKKSELRFLWKVLNELGYKFSSSTIPIEGIRKGPLIRGSIFELPVTGCPSWPTKVLDSWNFGFAPFRSVERADYIDQIEKISQEIHSGRKIIINIYADPSQVYDWPEFFEALEKLAPYNISSFEELINRIDN
jgi:peptidoglycan/xylan/chitin deacetylase (PgdA/CDA1 family)